MSFFLLYLPTISCLWSPNLVWSWGCYSCNMSWARIEWRSRSLSRSTIGFIFEFFFSWTCCHTKVLEPSLPYCLLILRGRTNGFIPYPRVLKLYKIKTASFRIWTQVAGSTPYDLQAMTLEMIGHIFTIKTLLWFWSTGKKLQKSRNAQFVLGIRFPSFFIFVKLTLDLYCLDSKPATV